MKQQIVLLGATGSVGQSTLSILRDHPDRYSLFMASGHKNVEQMLALVTEFKPQHLVVTEAQAYKSLQQRWPASSQTQLHFGEQALLDLVAMAEVDAVVAAIVGAAGLLPTLAAAKAGKKIILANKESLVIAGELLMAEARRNHALLLPIDSEHNALFQCLPQGKVDLSVSSLLLTASGGPFREHSLEQLVQVTPAQACKHPNWSMGQKISVDSATLMNKGLELIEACWLFDVNADQVEVVVHPQSIIHSMVRYVDGSVLAQLGSPDMRIPIAHALAWPERIASGAQPLDFHQLASLTFEPPDLERFPCLVLAREAQHLAGLAPVYLNAANEEAVAAFLNGQLAFMDIAGVNAKVLAQVGVEPLESVSQLQHEDQRARAIAHQHIQRLAL